MIVIKLLIQSSYMRNIELYHLTMLLNLFRFFYLRVVMEHIGHVVRMSVSGY